VTTLIWKGISIRSFWLFSQPPSAWADAWVAITELLVSGAVKPVVATTFPLEEAAAAVRYLGEGRPGPVVLTI
jgi:NADPH:quinone reductase